MRPILATLLCVAAVAGISCDVILPNGTFECLETECPDGMSCSAVDQRCYDVIPPCEPTTCAAVLDQFSEFGVTCGVFPDGCAGTISCNIEECACEDIYEDNDSIETARQICPPANPSCDPDEQTAFTGGFDVEIGPDGQILLTFDASDDEDWFSIGLTLNTVRVSAAGDPGVTRFTVGAACEGGAGTGSQFRCSKGRREMRDGVVLCVGTDDEPAPEVEAACLSANGSDGSVIVFFGAAPADFEPLCQDYEGKLSIRRRSASDVDNPL